MSAPVLDRTGRPLAVLSIWGPRDRVPEERFAELGDLVVRAAAQIAGTQLAGTQLAGTQLAGTQGTGAQGPGTQSSGAVPPPGGDGAVVA